MFVKFQYRELRNLELYCTLTIEAWHKLNMHSDCRYLERYLGDLLKGLPIVKALTCMKIYMYKQKRQFGQGDRYFWLFCCMSNLYISHGLIYVPTYSFLSTQQLAYQSFLTTSWFDSLCTTVARWLNFRERHLHEYEQQLCDYNV